MFVTEGDVCEMVQHAFRRCQTHKSKASFSGNAKMLFSALCAKTYTVNMYSVELLAD